MKVFLHWDVANSPFLRMWLPFWFYSKCSNPCFSHLIAGILTSKRMLEHVLAFIQMMKNTQKLQKVPFHHAHKRIMKKNKEKSLLVSDWEWLPNADRHLKAGYLLQILLILTVVLCLCFFLLNPLQNPAIMTSQCKHYFFVKGER